MSSANIITAMVALSELLNLARETSKMIADAEREGRDITEAELDMLRQRREELLVEMNEEIARRGGQ